MLLDLLPLFSPTAPGSGGGVVVGGGGRTIWPISQQPWPMPQPPLYEPETDDDETALAVLGAL